MFCWVFSGEFSVSQVLSMLFLLENYQTSAQSLVFPTSLISRHPSIQCCLQLGFNNQAVVHSMVSTCASKTRSPVLPGEGSRASPCNGLGQPVRCPLTGWSTLFWSQNIIILINLICQAATTGFCKVRETGLVHGVNFCHWVQFWGVNVSHPWGKLRTQSRSLIHCGAGLCS